MLSNKFITVKIGGSVLTDKKNPTDLNINLDLLRGVLRIIGNFCLEKNVKVLLCHGAGNYGHTKAKYFLENQAKLSKSEKSEMLKEIAEDVQTLHKVVKNIATEEIGEKYILGFEYGDVCFKGPKNIISTEEKILSFFEKSKLKTEQIIFLSDQDGIYKDFRNMQLGIITEIVLSDTNNEIYFGKSSDATGGMKQKLEMALKLLKYSENIWIINGLIPQSLNELLKGSKTYGTKIQTISNRI